MFATIASYLGAAALKKFSAKVWSLASKPPGTYVAIIIVFLLILWFVHHMGYREGAGEAQAAAKAQQAAAVDIAVKLADADRIARDQITLKSNVAEAYRQGLIDGAKASIPREVKIYVPQKIADVCVPFGIVKLLDGAGLATDPDALPGAADEPNEACSGVSVSRAAALLSNALIERADYEGRLLSAQGWIAAQQMQSTTSGGAK